MKNAPAAGTPLLGECPGRLNGSTFKAHAYRTYLPHLFPAYIYWTCLLDDESEAGAVGRRAADRVDGHGIRSCGCARVGRWTMAATAAAAGLQHDQPEQQQNKKSASAALFRQHHQNHREDQPGAGDPLCEEILREEIRARARTPRGCRSLRAHLNAHGSLRRSSIASDRSRGENAGSF